MQLYIRYADCACYKAEIVVESHLAVAGWFAFEAGHTHAGAHTDSDAGTDRNQNADDQYSDSNTYNCSDGDADRRLPTCRIDMERRQVGRQCNCRWNGPLVEEIKQHICRTRKRL